MLGLPLYNYAWALEVLGRSVAQLPDRFGREDFLRHLCQLLKRCAFD